MFKLKNLPLTISTIVVISLIVGWGISMVLAWTDPTANPPIDNVFAPINVSSTAQTKAGDLNIGGSLDVTGTVTAASFLGTISAANVSMGTFGSLTGYGNYDFKTSGESPILHIDALNARVGIGTTAPSYELDVSGDLRVTGTIYGTLAAGGAAGGWVDDGTNVRLETDTDEVGIGTTTPDYQLQVEKSTGDADIAITSNPSNWSSLLMGDTDGATGATKGALVYANDADRMIFFTNNVEQMTIRSDGDVGIGYADPGTAKLAINGNVGIGTTNPQSRLHVVGGDITLGHNNSISLWDGTNRTRVITGYGSYQWGHNLQISPGGELIIGAGEAGGALRGIAYGGGDGNESLYLAADGAIEFWIDLQDPAVSDRAMVINTSGNVGIGTTNPTTAKLVISSSGAAIDAGNQKIINLATPTADLDAANKSYVDSVIGGGEPGVYVNAHECTVDGTCETNDIRVGPVTDDDGSVAGWGNRVYFSGGDDWVGWNSDNSDPLYMGRYNTGNNTTDLRIIIGDDTGSSADRLTIGTTGNNELFVFNAAGKVGIGTTGPASLLQIGKDGEQVRVGVTTSGRSAVMGSKVSQPGGAANEYAAYFAYDAYFDDSDDTWKPVRTNLGRKWKMEMGYHTNDIRFSYSSGYSPISWSDLVTIKSSGNVGIGTTAPGEKLHVDGTFAYFTGAVIDDAGGKNLIPDWQMESDTYWTDYPEQTMIADFNGVNHYAHDSADAGHTSCYNWAHTALIPADPNKTYKFSLWIKSTDITMNNYFGFHIYASNKSRIIGDWNNPYFKTGENDANSWKKWTVYLGPSYAGGASNCDSSKTNGNDWCMASNTAYIKMRFGSCYADGDGTGNTYYMYPKIEEVNPDDSYITGDLFVDDGNITIDDFQGTKDEYAATVGYVKSSITAGDNDWAGVGGDLTLAGDIYHTGNVGIGTTSPDPNHRLTVDGSMRSQGAYFEGDVTVSGDLSWTLTQYDWATLPHAGISPMSIRMWDSYNTAGSPTTYGTLLDIYGRTSHEHSQLYFAHTGDIYYRDAFYNETNWPSFVELWHSGSDGSGSGLDADLLDNLHASSFCRSDGSNCTPSSINCADCDGRFVNTSGNETMSGSLTVNNIIAAQSFEYSTNSSYNWMPGAGWNIFYTPNGYIRLGPNVDGWADIETEEANFRFNKPLTVSGNLTANGTISLEGHYLKQSNSASVTAGNWYRIASNGGNRADATFTLRDFISGGGHSTARFHAGVNYGYAGGISFTLMNHSKYGTTTFTRVRIIEAGTYDGAYLEVYANRSGNVEYSMWDNEQSAGWTPVDWTAGSVPSGWIAHEYDIDKLFVVGGGDDVFTIQRNGDVTINKLYVTTIDPIYEIDGKKYATYVADFAGGVRTETSGVIQLNSEAKYVIDLENLEKGSDLWLFWETSNKEMDDLVVILSSGFEGRVWYHKDGHKLTIFGDESGEVSYRLTLPRLDDEKWENLVVDSE